MLTPEFIAQLNKWIAEGPRVEDSTPGRFVRLYGNGPRSFEIVHMEWADGVVEAHARGGEVVFVVADAIRALLKDERQSLEDDKTPRSHPRKSRAGRAAEEPLD